MSCIADVLQKATDEAAACRPSPGIGRNATDAHALPRAAEVCIPWSFDQTPKAVPNSPLSRLSDAAATLDDGQYEFRSRHGAVPRPYREVDDEIVSLVAQLFPLDGDGETEVRRALFTSVEVSRSSAEVATRVAEVLAQRANGVVCLADLNLQVPTLHLRHQLEGHAGFADALMQSGALRAFTHRAPCSSNLWVMPAGLRAADARPLLGSALTQRRLAELFGTFDYVVATTAPIGQHADAALLGAYVDGVVLVLEANRTRPEAARAACDALYAANTRVLGTVLNNRTFPIPDAVYRLL